MLGNLIDWCFMLIDRYVLCLAVLFITMILPDTKGTKLYSDKCINFVPEAETKSYKSLSG